MDILNQYSTLDEYVRKNFSPDHKFVKELTQLQKDQTMLSAYEMAGVDNWNDDGLVMKNFREMWGEENG